MKRELLNRDGSPMREYHSPLIEELLNEIKQEENMRQYIELSILWKDGDAVMLEDLGIETTYEQAITKQVLFRVDSIHYFYADKDPRYTCIKTANEEMVVDLSLKDFTNLLNLI
jgi:hypothetical protein